MLVDIEHRLVEDIEKKKKEGILLLLLNYFLDEFPKEKKSKDNLPNPTERPEEKENLLLNNPQKLNTEGQNKHEGKEELIQLELSKCEEKKFFIKFETILGV